MSVSGINFDQRPFTTSGGFFSLLFLRLFWPD